MGHALTSAERRALKARAHALEPVVTVGHAGLTPAVVHEIDRALEAHELVKVRIGGEPRLARAALCERVCRLLGAAPVQHIGKVLVLWRARSLDVPPED